MIKILFVCHGNICRSPMAEYILKNIVKEAGKEKEFLISSAATSREEIGNDIYPPAKTCLKNHRIPFSKHRARQITRDDLDHYDYIIAMEKYNIANLQRLLGPSSKYRLLLEFAERDEAISDPWYSGDFELTYTQIDEGCRTLYDKLSSE